MSSILFVLAIDILSKILDKGAISQVFTPHPNCFAPLITHLSFAYDVLLFFDKSQSSLTGIMQMLEDFNKKSGLKINKEKTSLFLDGGSTSLALNLVAGFGTNQGELPVKYLGLPLCSQKLNRQDCQVLIDKVAGRFSAWTVKHLSFAGRLQLITSVIYSMICFWASVFLLPKYCLKTIDSMCASFLWKGTHDSGHGAKVSWDIVCSPKESKGLGLRRLSEWNKILGLKLIWLLFAAAGSLWVSWLKVNYFRGGNLWSLTSRQSDSWLWKKLCKLKELARPFIVCQLGSGITANFWLDNWTGLGPLIHLTGPIGPQVTGLPAQAAVADAIRGNRWIFSTRSRNPVITLLRQCLPPPEPIIESETDDVFLWKCGSDPPSSVFSSSKTFQALHPVTATVQWASSVWCKGRIPRHSFLSWLIALERLSTRDRRNWGLQVPPACVLCNNHDESHQHLFFDCDYSNMIWSSFTSKENLQAPQNLLDCLIWLKKPSKNYNISLIIRLLFHATAYAIWKERNARIHSAVSRPHSVLISDIQLTIRRRLDPLSRQQRNLPSTTSFLSSWFSVFQP